MSEQHPDVAQAQQAVAAMEGQQLADRVSALEQVAASLDAALSDNAD